MFEIVIAVRARFWVARTRYDAAAGCRFPTRERAEQFCRALNRACRHERFLVLRAGQRAQPAMRAAA